MVRNARWELDEAIQRYDLALKHLLEQPKYTEAAVLAVLVARDQIQVLMSNQAECSVANLLKLHRLDKQLEKRSNKITRTINFEEYRFTRHPSSEAWWWFLPSAHWYDRFNGAFQILTVGCLAFSVSVLTSIITRLLGSGDDSPAPAILSAITLLNAGTLTKPGQELLQGIFNNIGLPKRFWHGIVFLLTVFWTVTLVRFQWNCLPQLAVQKNNEAAIAIKEGKLSTAREDLEAAIRLKPDYAQAHYNLGEVYQRLDDLQRAKTVYRVAAKGGLPEAYNNLGFLYIQEKKYNEAALFLLEGQKLVQSSDLGEEAKTATLYKIKGNLEKLNIQEQMFEME